MPYLHTPEQTMLFAAFIAMWMLLGFGGYLFFHEGKNAQSKRYWFPRFCIIAGALFIGFVSAMDAAGPQESSFAQAVLEIGPVVTLVTWLNIHFARFCSMCARLRYKRSFVRPEEPCPFCRHSHR